MGSCRKPNLNRSLCVTLTVLALQGGASALPSWAVCAAMRTTCAQCGQTADLRSGRCGACGAAIDVSEIIRHQRRAALLRVIGDEWYWWLVEIVAVVLICLVVVDMLPLWTLAVVAVLLLRALSRLLVLLVRGGLDQLPG